MLPTPNQMLTMMGTIRDNLLVIEERNSSRCTLDAITDTAFANARRALDEFHDPIAEAARDENRRDPAKALFTPTVPFYGNFRDFNRMDIEVGATVRIHENVSRMDYGEGEVIGLGSLTDSTNASVYVRFEDDERLGEFSPGQVIVVRAPVANASTVQAIATIIYDIGRTLELEARNRETHDRIGADIGGAFMTLGSALTESGL